MAKNKFYVVWIGHRPGIYSDWESCERQIKGYPAARFKSFENRQEAEHAFVGNAAQYVNRPAKKFMQAKTPRISISNSNIIKESLAVDAASSGNPGVMEYRGVHTETGEQLFHKGPFPQGTNNIGEFLAIVHGLAYLKQQNLNWPIYTDSVTGLSWLRHKKAKTKLERNAINKELFDLVDRAEKWLRENTYKTRLIKWETTSWGEIPADFGRK